jgi:hypothetical protein
VLQTRPVLAQIALAVIAVVDVMSVNQGRFLAPQPPAPENDIERVAAAPRGRDAYYRVAYDKTTSQDFGSIVGVDGVSGTAPLMLLDYRRLLNAVDEYRRNVLLNVQVVVTNGLYTDRAYELAAQRGDNFKYYRFVDAKPRAYLVRNVVEVPDSIEAARRIAAPDFDHWNTALVVGATGLGQGSDLSPPEGAQVISRSANAITLQAVTTQPRLLVLAETYYPGWQAEMDGVPAPLYQTNVALRGVVVPPGVHTVTMYFRPVTLFIGVGLSLLTCVGLLVWLGLSLATGRSPRWRR